VALSFSLCLSDLLELGGVRACSRLQRRSSPPVLQWCCSNVVLWCGVLQSVAVCCSVSAPLPALGDLQVCSPLQKLWSPPVVQCCCSAVAVLLQCCCSTVAVLMQCCCSVLARRGHAFDCKPDIPPIISHYTSRCSAVAVMLQCCCNAVAELLQCCCTVLARRCMSCCMIHRSFLQVSFHIYKSLLTMRAGPHPRTGGESENTDTFSPSLSLSHTHTLTHFFLSHVKDIRANYTHTMSILHQCIYILILCPY